MPPCTAYCCSTRQKVFVGLPVQLPLTSQMSTSLQLAVYPGCIAQVVPTPVQNSTCCIQYQHSRLTCAASSDLPDVNIIAAGCVPRARCTSCCVTRSLAGLAHCCACTRRCPAAAVGCLIRRRIHTHIGCAYTDRQKQQRQQWWRR
jgi:hypothetical protein